MKTISLALTALFLVWASCWTALRADAPQATQSEQLLFDFEAGPLSNDWAVAGRVSASREEIPDPPADSETRHAPSGHGLRLRAAERGGLFSNGQQSPESWSRIREIAFWVHRSSDEAQQHPTSILEVQLVEADGLARFVRRIELNNSGWQQQRLALRWFRWGDGRVPHWDRVKRIGLVLRGPSDLAIDAIRVLPGTDDQSAEIPLAELRELAFPGLEAKQVHELAADHVTLLSNAAALDAPSLLDHLKLVSDEVHRLLPFLERCSQPPKLLVFATPDEYRAFPARLAERLGARGVSPRAGGYTVQGLATSFWDDALGTRRPVYTHEFVHAILCQATSIQARGEWVQEGLANLIQLKFHPQADFAEIVTRGLRDERRRLPLDQLCAGKEIPLDRYWQAATVVETLLLIEPYRGSVQALLDAFSRTGSTDLGPHLQPVLHTSWDQLTVDWHEHCRRTYDMPGG